MRSQGMLALDFLNDVHVATDDGTQGFHGTIIQCVEEYFGATHIGKPKMFTCGPNAMLDAAASFAAKNAIPCEVSLECTMACGIGICQGCPVEMTNGDRKYNLVCKMVPSSIQTKSQLQACSAIDTTDETRYRSSLRSTCVEKSRLYRVGNIRILVSNVLGCRRCHTRCGHHKITQQKSPFRQSPAKNSGDDRRHA